MSKYMDQSLEVVGYFTQYTYLNTIRLLNTYENVSSTITRLQSLYKNTYLILTYLKLTSSDTFDYYYAYMILSLPSYMFGYPLLKISQSDIKKINSNEDSDNEFTDDPKEYEIFVSQLNFILKKNERSPTMTQEVLNGLQLTPFIDKKGRFFIGHIQQYYPDLDTIFIKYYKNPVDTNDSEYSSTPNSLTKIIDVAKRYDVRNHQSCKFGVYL